MRKCNNCNKEYNDNVLFCISCGSKLEEINEIENKTKKFLTFLSKNKKSLLVVFRYTFGIILMWAGLLMFNQFSGIICFLSGFFLLPINFVLLSYIKNKWFVNFLSNNSKLLQVILPSLFFILWLFIPIQENLTQLNIVDNNIVIGVNSHYQINYQSNLKKPENYKFSYTSSDENIATVSSDGTIFGISEGSVTITMKGKNNIYSEATYVVKYIKLENITLSGETKIAVDNTYSLKVELLPLNTSEYDLQWKSSNSDIISVDENGNVTAHKKGTAIISAMEKNGVVGNIEITSFAKVDEIIISSSNNSIEKGKTLKLNVQLFPDDAELGSINWHSESNYIATVDNNGIVTANNVGSTTIVAESLNGVTSQYKVDVFEIEAQSVNLNKSSVTLRLGDSLQLIANVLPNNTSDKTIKWSSNDSTIATVDDNGKVKTLKRGKATITATTTNHKTASVDIVIQQKSPIKVNNFRYSIDSVCGVEWTFSITNNSGKTIDYINLTWYNFNAVGDFVYDQISYDSFTKLTYTGPLKNGVTTTRYRNTRKFYNCSYKNSAFYEYAIRYSDGSTEIIKLKDFDYLYNAY